ncbi:heterokaryon incompatibility protein-domain-containing protein [Cercophora newfieldiana]|uniref:Heterokaryon incompatibility protein-domain-containing protein n=1 Tax=Cercophora newfieldiana TaxID=92897 RepID=A0AA39XVF9_9PEZI|nr:heterokaryon incompatibility protein-domain-containing protein [Cercophora newfieldiana]
MRLIKTDSLELVEFVGRAPPYVILSHTWGPEELTCQDLLTAASRAIAKKKAGFAKIAGCCARALEDGYEYAWVDTCCIDKSSSAELSEAINSMYRWYQDAHICYAYMSDVSINGSSQPPAISSSPDVVSAAKKRAADPPAKPLLHTIPSILRDYDSLPRTFENSRWFTRGWTLQELIAPPLVEFYAQDWKEIGTKFSLRRAISRITGVDIRVLEGADPSTCTVAERMSWAASRETTRVEDKAYCLLGIFKVNMPLIYGEGARAFPRLQKEIMKTTEDYTMLAWGLSKYLSNKHHWRGVPGAVNFDQRRPLADSPNDFEVHNRSQWTYANLIPDSDSNISTLKPKAGVPDHDDTPPLITSRGLRVTLLTRFNPKTCDVQAYINCKTPNPSNSHSTPVPVCLILHRHPSTNIYTGASDPNAAFLLLDNTAALSNFERRTIYISTQTAEGDAASQNHRATSLERNLYVLDRPPLQKAGDPAIRPWKITSCFSHAVGAGAGHAHFEVPRKFIPAQLFNPFDLPPSTVRIFAFERGPGVETFAIVVGSGWCSVVGLMEDGFKERWGVLVKEGRWDDRAALRFICAAAQKDGEVEGEGEGGPVDRVKKKIGEVDVTVALKKVRKGDVGCESAVKIVWTVG